MTTVVFGLIMKGEFLSPAAETIMSVVTLAAALAVFAFAYYAYRHEAINRLITAGRSLRTGTRPTLNRCRR
jgi:hypothetical protein